MKRYGPVTASDHVSLEVSAGEFLTLLGPSGSGKTTLLMLIAGFEVPDAGEIILGGRDVSRLPPNKRDLGMVFQRYALFPHMSVEENIAFPLRMRRVSPADQKRRVAEALTIVKLSEYAQRMPAQLSGGQQQRVALARAIVFDPGVILMDEPLGALDRKLRQHMQVELKELQKRLGATVIYVTHDQDEALAMSDRVAVVNNGRLEQVDKPRALYDQPASAFVADFVGEVNFMEGEVKATAGTETDVSVAGVTLKSTARRDTYLAAGQKATVAIRPERIRVALAGKGEQLGIPGRVVQSIFNGASVAVYVALPDGTLTRAVLGPSAAEAWLPAGTPVCLVADPENVFVFAPGGLQ